STVIAGAISLPSVRVTLGRMPGEGQPPSRRTTWRRSRHCQLTKWSRRGIIEEDGSIAVRLRRHALTLFSPNRVGEARASCSPQPDLASFPFHGFRRGDPPRAHGG